jgi:hypothetical protein
LTARVVRQNRFNASRCRQWVTCGENSTRATRNQLPAEIGEEFIRYTSDDIYPRSGKGSGNRLNDRRSSAIANKADRAFV